MLGGTFVLWGLHHLDYPILRARGAWNPWGYYLDAFFLLVAGAGILLLVIEELRHGISTLSALSADLQRRDRDGFLDGLLRRPLTLSGVRGTALFSAGPPPAAVRGVGACSTWEASGAPAAIRTQVTEALQSGHPLLRSHPGGASSVPPFSAVLPLAGHGPAGMALAIVGEAAAPFAALDDRILVAIGEQIGAALEGAELNRALTARSADLERLSVRMIQQHEEQRQRLARELHDETAQVFSALKLQLGSLREDVAGELSPRIDRLLELVNAGRMSIRSVTEDLRPSLLDDLGLVPALRALVSDFRGWSGVATTLEVPSTLPHLNAETDLALFRAVQEGLSNVARHAQASEVRVRVGHADGRIRLSIEDDGVGLESDDIERAAGGPGRSGLFGMRERIAMQGGTVSLGRGESGGLRLEVELPVTTEANDA
jgi:signal transduction histidine kinase